MKLFRFVLIALVFSLIISACLTEQADIIKTPEPQSKVVPTSTATPEWFDWFNMPLTDVRTGKTFTMNDYAGKVVLLETMAIWCPTCILQAGQVQKLHRELGNPEDLISVTLDVDSNEDEAMLKQYVDEWGLDWHFAVAPLLVERALANLYNVEYLNPPLSPMLIIDRSGNVHQLKYGLKEFETLKKIVEPYLAK